MNSAKIPTINIPNPLKHIFSPSAFGWKLPWDIFMTRRQAYDLIWKTTRRTKARTMMTAIHVPRWTLLNTFILHHSISSVFYLKRPLTCCHYLRLTYRYLASNFGHCNVISSGASLFWCSNIMVKWNKFHRFAQCGLGRLWGMFSLFNGRCKD